MARSEGSDVKGVAATSENSSKELSKFILKLFLIFVVCLLAGYGIVTKFGTKPSAGRDVETFDGKREAGDRAKFEIDGVEFVFRYCPAGSFIMGSDDEGRHAVELTRGFWLQETELTEEQWNAVMGEQTKRQSRRRSSWYDDYDDDSSNSTTDRAPARGHSWAECQKFVLKMNEKPELPNGWRVSLPTEAQWEYACRAKPQGIWGRLFGGKNAPPKPKEESEPENIFDARDEMRRETRRALAKVDKYAWCAENTGGERGFWGISTGGKPRSVGLKEPNRWGFYDMLGNVSEWCLDYYGEYPFGKVVDPARLDSGDDLLWDADGKRVWLYGEDASRVARGGSCMNSASACNPTKRLSYSTLLWDEDAPVGARLALVSSDAPELLSQQDYEAIVAEADAEDEEGRERIVNLSKAREAREFRPGAAFSVESFDATPGKPGERRVLKIGNVEFAFRYCPPGKFSMGSDVGEGYSWERPRRDVKIGAGYWLQETETTQEQWLAVALDNPSAAQGKELPVERVTWSDCQRFVERLNGAPGGLPEGWAFSLPTEAQWEYACRAGTTEERYGKLDDVAWYRYNGDQTAKRGGQKKPNAWGLCDMLGGVEEWVLDEFAAYPDLDGTAKESDEKNLRVRRGGSVASDPEYCRAAFRYPRPEDDRNKFAGFRLAIVATKELEAFNAEYSFALTPFELADGEPGERRILKVGEVEVPFRYCPSGEFTMGSPEDEEGRSSNETQHKVVLTQGFWIMETEATHKLWKAITGKKAKDYKGDFLPVVRSWNDWKEIVDKLNVALGETTGGWRFALPTEAQWEYACRAGTTGARYGEISEIADLERRSFRWEPRAVGALKPNAWGLYDVLGNVSEWCADWSSDYKDYPKGDAVDPVGPAKGSERVIRGGDQYGSEFRAAERNDGYPDSGMAGARLVLARPIQSALGRKIVPFDPNGAAGERRVLKIGDVEFAFRYCPPGEFLMGSPEGSGESNERPQRNVSLTNGYWIMETEITEKQWAIITRDESDLKEKNEQKPKRVSWEDCQKFLKTLNGESAAVPEGWRYALPTEAQWEYACRAGSTESRYGALDEIAWHEGNRKRYELEDVGQKKPNAWGLYDSIGNALEWCEDWYDFYPEGDATDPVGPSEGSYRVARGGTSTSETADCRAARRFRVKPDERYGYDMGARFVLVRDAKRDESVSSDTKASSDWAGEADDLKKTISSFDPSATEAGERRVLKIGDVEFAFRYCPPGEFAMGSSNGEGFANERPKRDVTLTKGFWLQETELTQAQWKTLMESNPSSCKAARRPVERVSRRRVAEFISKLNAESGAAPEGWRYGLPTEAQWEYACRAGTTDERRDELDVVAWHGENSGSETHPVGQKKPNAWGFYDMLGNVWELCEDEFGAYSEDEVVDPSRTPESANRVMRGGSWSSRAEDCRAARRSLNYCLGNFPDTSIGASGFRLALSTSPSDKDAESTGSESVSDSSAAINRALEEETQDPILAEASTFDPNASEAGERRVLTIGDVEFAFRYCPPGEFAMGSEEDEWYRYHDETRHKVKLTQGFWLTETELTQSQWEAVTGDNPSKNEGNNKPVERVSWFDCQRFVEKLNDASRVVPDGWRFALPTEAQWEYACRAGTTDARYNDDLDAIAWRDENSDGKTHAVGFKKPNDWGFYDILGNVDEWCEDYYGAFSEEAVEDPLRNEAGDDRDWDEEGVFVWEFGTGTRRVARGGGYNSYFKESCSASDRQYYAPNRRADDLGVRIALIQSASR